MVRDLLEKLPSGKIVAKDLSIDKSLVPGNPYCRFDTDDSSRKYCSRDLWESAEKKFVIPEDGKIPRRMIVCESCGKDSFKEDQACGRCGEPIFVCPAADCEEEIHGRPDECPACGSKYKWEKTT